MSYQTHSTLPQRTAGFHESGWHRFGNYFKTAALLAGLTALAFGWGNGWGDQTAWRSPELSSW